MLRQALSEFVICTSNSRLLRQKLEKFQMNRVCNRFSSILSEWRITTTYIRETTRRQNILKSKLAIKMKKLCLRLLSKNSKRIKAER